MKICTILDETTKSGSEIGRPIVMNMHTGRGVSALARDKENRDFTGIVNILVLLLVLSNFKNIMKNIDERGWVVGTHFIDVLKHIDKMIPDHIGYIISLQFLISSPVISYFIEKYLAPNPKMPRMLLFFLIV